MTEQMTFEGEHELIPGAKRDEKGKIQSRWIRLERTTGGLAVICPGDVTFEVVGGKVVLQWGRCLCNVGVQECPEHPGRLRSKEEKIAFRKRWDEAVDAGS